MKLVPCLRRLEKVNKGRRVCCFVRLAFSWFVPLRFLPLPLLRDDPKHDEIDSALGRAGRLPRCCRGELDEEPQLSLALGASSGHGNRNSQGQQEKHVSGGLQGGKYKDKALRQTHTDQRRASRPIN